MGAPRLFLVRLAGDGAAGERPDTSSTLRPVGVTGAAAVFEILRLR